MQCCRVNPQSDRINTGMCATVWQSHLLTLIQHLRKQADHQTINIMKSVALFALLAVLLFVDVRGKSFWHPFTTVLSLPWEQLCHLKFFKVPSSEYLVTMVVMLFSRANGFSGKMQVPGCWRQRHPPIKHCKDGGDSTFPLMPKCGNHVSMLRVVMACLMELADSLCIWYSHLCLSVFSVTLKNNGGQKCLNPESRFAKNYIKRAIKKR